MILAALLALVAQAVAATNLAPAATLPAGTAVRLATVVALDSRSLVQGQRIGMTIADDVRVGSRLVIPRGTPAVGEIEALAQKGMFGEAARFVLRPLFVEVAGHRINLVGAHVERGRNDVAAAAVAAVLLGGIGMTMTGKSAILPANSVIDGATRTDVLIAAPGAAPGAAPVADLAPAPDARIP